MPASAISRCASATVTARGGSLGRFLRARLRSRLVALPPLEARGLLLALRRLGLLGLPLSERESRALLLRRLGRLRALLLRRFPRLRLGDPEALHLGPLLPGHHDAACARLERL